MATADEKVETAHHVEHDHKSDIEVAVDGDDGTITLKTKLAVLVCEINRPESSSRADRCQALIFMYESYLFTLIMPAAVLT